MFCLESVHVQITTTMRSSQPQSARQPSRKNKPSDMICICTGWILHIFNMCACAMLNRSVKTLENPVIISCAILIRLLFASFCCVCVFESFSCHSLYRSHHIQKLKCRIMILLLPFIRPPSRRDRNVCIHTVIIIKSNRIGRIKYSSELTTNLKDVHIDILLYINLYNILYFLYIRV